MHQRRIGLLTVHITNIRSILQLKNIQSISPNFCTLWFQRLGERQLSYPCSITFYGLHSRPQSIAQVFVTICEAIESVHSDFEEKILSLGCFTKAPTTVRWVSKPQEINGTGIFVNKGGNRDVLIRRTKQVLRMFGYNLHVDCSKCNPNRDIHNCEIYVLKDTAADQLDWDAVSNRRLSVSRSFKSRSRSWQWQRPRSKTTTAGVRNTCSMKWRNAVSRPFKQGFTKSWCVVILSIDGCFITENW